jgi:hypothetical protein
VKGYLRYPSITVEEVPWSVSTAPTDSYRSVSYMYLFACTRCLCFSTGIHFHKRRKVIIVHLFLANGRTYDDRLDSGNTFEGFTQVIAVDIGRHISSINRSISSDLNLIPRHHPQISLWYICVKSSLLAIRRLALVNFVFGESMIPFHLKT